MPSEKKEQTSSGVKLHNSPKELSHSLLKTLCICNIICVVIVFSMSGLMSKGTWGIIVTELIAIGITGLTLYAQSWSMGDKDANLIQFGRMEYDSKKALKMGLRAIAPSLISDILLVISKISGVFNFLWVYRLMNAPVWPLINLIHPYGLFAQEATEETVIMQGTQYEEVIEAMDATPGCGWGKLILMMLLPLIYLIFIYAGYELGRRRISIGNKLVYEDKDGSKNKKSWKSFWSK